MATFFCSDPHAYHGNIMKYCRRVDFMTDADRAAFLEIEASGGDLRGMRVSKESVEAMNRGLARNINARVGPDDVLWCLGDWAFGHGSEGVKNARRFRETIACQTIHLVWGNHDDRRIADLFASTHDQAEVREGDAQITLNHYPMLTWNGQHHGSIEAPNIHLYGHVHGRYQVDPETCPVRDASAWAALDVGFDGHAYQVWSIAEVLDQLRPKLEAFQTLRRDRGQFDPFRGRADRLVSPAATRT